MSLLLGTLTSLRFVLGKHILPRGAFDMLFKSLVILFDYTNACGKVFSKVVSFHDPNPKCSTLLVS